ncbi:small ubiquitin-related modifier 3-like [Passer montanus]|uniref:small ubiquitin-related modifier 3-like n=1 Tax=Passer montanus TaxID=9160 RepID=UPI0019602572|nr:small ubiquitin-related modifier 3-like [Passer montanus]
MSNGGPRVRRGERREFSVQACVKTEPIDLKVVGPDGSVVQFRMKRQTPLSKLMEAYCSRQGLSMRHIMFLFDGQPIKEADTPAQLEMEHDDTIEVYQQQTGGGGSDTASLGEQFEEPHHTSLPHLSLDLLFH